jgi:hypothetical protein
MAYYTFTFRNTQDDQSFSFVDEINDVGNPHQIGAVNHDTDSPEQKCWVGGDNKGSITLTGTVGPSVIQEIPNDGYSFDY